MPEQIPMKPNDSIYVGEGENKTEISLQKLQHIFHEITGKSEELSKRFETSFYLDMSSISNIYHRIKQTLEQYSIISSNCDVTVYFLDDTKQQFSSFEAFSTFGAGSTSIVQNILINYNFIICPPIIKKMQSYTITVKLNSRVAIEKDFLNQNVPQPRLFRYFLSKITAIVTIKYVDYNVARNLMHTIDTCISTSPQQNKLGYINFLQKHSSFISYSIRYLITIITIIFVLYYISNLSKGTDVSLITVASIIIISVSFRISSHLADFIEEKLDMHSDLSYLEITQGDSREIDLAKLRKRGNIRLGIMAAFLAIAQASTVKLIVEQIFLYLNK